MELATKQNNILRTVSQFDTNVHITAVPGSAKTTTCLYIAKKMYRNEYFCWYTTYAHILKHYRDWKDWKTSIVTRFIHSDILLLMKKRKDNISLDHICQQNDYNVSFYFDVLIIDEEQDMTMLLYRFIKKCHSYFIYKCPIVVVGDSCQCIFSYKGADHHFLTLAPNIIQWNNYSWVKKTQSVMFRCSAPICDFINSCLTPSDLRLLIPNRRTIFYTFYENNILKIVALMTNW